MGFLSQTVFTIFFSQIVFKTKTISKSTFSPPSKGGLSQNISNVKNIYQAKKKVSKSEKNQIRKTFSSQNVHQVHSHGVHKTLEGLSSPP